MSSREFVVVCRSMLVEGKGGEEGSRVTSVS